jgi:hypothetical protein
MAVGGKHHHPRFEDAAAEIHKTFRRIQMQMIMPADGQAGAHLSDSTMKHCLTMLCISETYRMPHGFIRDEFGI